jgi:hypothetical protein
VAVYDGWVRRCQPFEKIMRQDMTLENELCLLLLRRDLAAVRKRTMELLASPLQWQVVLEKAYQYEIAPLLYRQLEILGFPSVPETIRTELENFLAVNAIRNDLLAKELARLLRLLVDAKIPVMPLKSTVLAETLYEDPAFRVCTDIDLLVPTNDVIAAHNLILSLGYQSQITQPFFLNLLARYGKDCELMREDRLCAYLLELHWGLVWGGRLERDLLKNIWADAVRKSFHGVPAFALSPDWEFLYLATHAARHGRVSLKWFVDLDRFCSRGTLDWASIKQKAQQLGWEDAVRDSLSACAYLLGTPIDPAFAPATSQRWPHTMDTDALEVPGGMFFLFRLLKTPAQKLRYLAIRLLVPTPADGQFLALPSSLTFLYYVLRPFRFAAKAARWCLQAGVKSLRRFE